VANPLLTEAIACLEANQLERAQLLAEQAASLDARDADAWHLAGVALARQGQHARAVDALGRAIAINPESAQFHANLGNAQYEQGQYSQAVDSYRRAIALDPSIGGVGKQLAHACERQLDLGIAHHRSDGTTRPNPATKAFFAANPNAAMPGTCWAFLLMSAKTTPPRSSL
jgi:tetratricopeptide (TPR) repeat protein